MILFIKKGRILALMFMLLGCLAIQAADDLITQQITVKLDEAGTLSNKIGSSKKYKITNLKIIGEINGSDLSLITDMAGRYNIGYLWQPSWTEGKLSTLDLSEAKIVKGGASYLYDENLKPKYYTDDNCVGDLLFCGCRCLTSLTLPSSVTSIGYGAFEKCYSLASVNIPSSVTSIGSNNFYGCTSLTDVNIPSSVTYIGNDAF